MKRTLLFCGSRKNAQNFTPQQELSKTPKLTQMNIYVFLKQTFNCINLEIALNIVVYVSFRKKKLQFSDFRQLDYLFGTSVVRKMWYA